MSTQISLADDVSSLAAAQADAGGYDNAAEYLSDLIRDEERKRRQLRDLLAEGEASGLSSLSIDAIIESEFAAISRA